MKTTFIGIGHKKQQGKDTFAAYLKTALKVNGHLSVIQPFAEPLKNLAMGCFGLTPDQCYGSDADKNSLTAMTNYQLDSKINIGKTYGYRAPEYLLTARQVLQELGASMRLNYPGIWSNAPFTKYANTDHDFVILPDLRHRDEARRVQSRRGHLINIVRSSSISTDTHNSETELDNYEGWSQVIDNSGNLNYLRLRAQVYADELSTLKSLSKEQL